jgi:glycosyltransferase involved in cell wall biosynthesis
MNNKVIAVIPAYNEEKTIGNVIKELKKYVDVIIVVDDASVDDTAKKAKNNSAIVVNHKKNMGYDKTIDDGFKQAAKQNASVIFTFDADGQHIASDVPKLIDPILHKKADVVVGIRPYKQRFAEKVFSRYAKKKIGIKDALCGMKAYSADAYKKVGYFDKLNSIGTELMFNCHKLGFKIVEVPIKMQKRQVGKSGFGNSLSSNYKMFKALIKIFFKFK